MAIATNIPEIVTSIMAALKGQIEIVIANLVGSNISRLGILGATVLISPVSTAGFNQIDFIVMLLFA